MPENGYPTDEELHVLESWPWGEKPYRAVYEYVESIWSHGYGVMLTEDIKGDFGDPVKRIYWATGGWSGNESIISALESAGNGMFWFADWYMSKRGGAFEFRIPMTRWDED